MFHKKVLFHHLFLPLLLCLHFFVLFIYLLYYFHLFHLYYHCFLCFYFFDFFITFHFFFFFLIFFFVPSTTNMFTPIFYIILNTSNKDASNDFDIKFCFSLFFNIGPIIIKIYFCCIYFNILKFFLFFFSFFIKREYIFFRYIIISYFQILSFFNNIFKKY